MKYVALASFAVFLCVAIWAAWQLLTLAWTLGEFVVLRLILKRPSPPRGDPAFTAFDKTVAIAQTY